MSTEIRTASDAGLDTLAAPKKRTFARSTNPLNETGISQCFQVVRTEMYVSLAPMYMENPINGIKAQHLDPLIMTYFPKLQGVVLGYMNIQMSKEHYALDTNESPITLSKITDSSPFSFIWIFVDLLIWKPQIGDVLEGHVFIQSASHIGLLVQDTFNATIKYRNIPEDWEFVPSQADEIESEQSQQSHGRFKSYGHWVDGSGTKVEGKLRFTTRLVHTNGRMVSIEGTLVLPESEKEAQPVSEISASVSTSKHMKFDSVEPEAEAVQAEKPVGEFPTYTNDEDENIAESSSEESDLGSN